MLLSCLKIMPRLSCALGLLALSMSWHAVRAQTAGEQIIAALERYRVAVLEADLDHIVSSFTEDAQLAQGSEPVVQGRTTIRALLNAQRSIKVVAFDLRVAAPRVHGSTAIQNGIYSQLSFSPQHEAMSAKGLFEVQWVRQVDGTWLISRLQTDQVE